MIQEWHQFSRNNNNFAKAQHLGYAICGGYLGT